MKEFGFDVPSDLAVFSGFLLSMFEGVESLGRSIP